MASGAAWRGQCGALWARYRKKGSFRSTDSVMNLIPHWVQAVVLYQPLGISPLLWVCRTVRSSMIVRPALGLK